MEFNNLKEAVKGFMKAFPNPYGIILEGTSAIYETYRRRREMLKENFVQDIFNGQVFAFKLDNKIFYYSTIFGLSGALDILGSILISKEPKIVILIGTCHLTTEVDKVTIVIPKYAETELLPFKGEADKNLINIANEIIESRNLDVIISDRHLTKLSFLETFEKDKEESAISIDMETSLVYYLANKYNIPAIAILGVADYRTKDGKIKFVEYEGNLKDVVFDIGLDVIRAWRNIL